MTGKIQIAILSAALAFSGSVAHQAVVAASNNPRMLYLVAQYKIFRGDAESAVQLLRKAATVAQNRPSVPTSGNCPHPQKS